MTDDGPQDLSPLPPSVRRALDERLGRPADADEALLARVKTRVLEALAQESQVPFTTARAADGGWETVAPGVERRVLADTAGQPSLWRVAPGGRVPGHVHDVDEECLVLEGSVRIGEDLVLSAGDYHVARRGSTHPTVWSDTGALVYLRGAPACPR